MAQDSTAIAEAHLIVRVWKTHESSEPGGNSPKPGDPALSLILDLISASHGVAAISPDKTVSVTFSGIEPAILTARRLQWGIQGFSESEGNFDTAIAILAHRAADRPDQAALRSLQVALQQADAGQILIAPSIADALEGLPSLHLQKVPDSIFQEFLWRSSAIAPNRSLDEEAISAFILQNGLENEAPSPTKVVVSAEPLPFAMATRVPGAYPPVVNEPIPPTVVPVSRRGGNPRMLYGAAGAALILIVVVAVIALSHRSTPSAAPVPSTATGHETADTPLNEETPTSSPSAKPSDPTAKTPAAQGSPASPPLKDRKTKVRAESEVATPGRPEKPKESAASCTLESGPAQTTLELADNYRSNSRYEDAIRLYERVQGCAQFSARAQRGLELARAALRQK
jgi:hypothetical protein